MKKILSMVVSMVLVFALNMEYANGHKFDKVMKEYLRKRKM